VRGVKFAAYFGQLTAGTGALRLVPGSHHPEQHAAYQRRQPPVRSDADAATYWASVIERMRHAGILDLPGAQEGW
jgi:hypothetical protein